MSISMYARRKNDQHSGLPSNSEPRSLIMLLVAVICFLFILFSQAELRAAERDVASVKKVVDGDTVILRLHGAEEKARLLGVDTPEKNHPFRSVQYFSYEASEFLRKLCEGKKVFIEYDRERRDLYGRLLVYLFLEDGRQVNAEIIREGYGFVYAKYPFQRQEEFKKYEAEARAHGRGLWKNGGIDELRWLISIGRKPFQVYEMAGNKWAIECEGYARTGLNDKELLTELSNLKIWIHELKDDDLKRMLAENGWMELGN